MIEYPIQRRQQIYLGPNLNRSCINITAVDDSRQEITQEEFTLLLQEGEVSYVQLIRNTDFLHHQKEGTQVIKNTNFMQCQEGDAQVIKDTDFLRCQEGDVQVKKNTDFPQKGKKSNLQVIKNIVQVVILDDDSEYQKIDSFKFCMLSLNLFGVKHQPCIHNIALLACLFISSELCKWWESLCRHRHPNLQMHTKTTCL